MHHALHACTVAASAVPPAGATGVGQVEEVGHGDDGIVAGAGATQLVDEHVVPGDPDGSLLVQLLEGTAMGGTFTQMPLSVKFVDMPDTQISIGEIRAWISAL